MELGSLTGSATSIITNAQQKANTAAQTIANLPVQNEEVGSSQNVASSDLFKPVLSLKQAEQENYAGAKVLKVSEDTVGSILNIRA